MMVAVSGVMAKLPTLERHMDRVSSIKLAVWWRWLIGVILPIVLIIMLVQELDTKVAEPYGGYPDDLINVFGWGMAAALPIIAIGLSLIPWRRGTVLSDDPDEIAAAEEAEDALLVDGGDTA